MASLTIGGQDRELRLTATALKAAERRILKLGGRRLLATFADAKEPFLAIDELEALVVSAWTPALSEATVQTLLAQWYAEGGTLFELHTEVIDALIDSGLLGRRASTNGSGPPADPPEARTPA